MQKENYTILVFFASFNRLSTFAYHQDLELDANTLLSSKFPFTSGIDTKKNPDEFSHTLQDFFKFGARHLRVCYNITCSTLPQYLWQGIYPNRTLQEIL